ncbi:hypothetical protein MPNT_210049 [Candidatus Methylacidithermus pantelleriae]|uniref:Uncharacterized protein n=1 Tax=Candidatus Methylacidithermus pantelleriae TaxID=2744239 RepID=A0A8J2FSM0_9BACT|nr:hypothetical protein MPNT_210049 [Candidatus Methylacidithermus pantelleriae]
MDRQVGRSGVLRGAEKGEEKELGQWEPAPARKPKASSLKLERGEACPPAGPTLGDG